MNKIDQIMSWYDGLREDLRFLAFMFFIMLPFTALYILHPFIGMGYIILVGISRLSYQTKVTRVKVKKNERDNA
jgi:hypothetical protein